jgi:WhiB family transcriptional regulator, redox-sensing transcriptional regulator
VSTIATGSIQNWQAKGACLSADPDLFFPISSTGPALRQIERAKAICARCTVRRECLEFAVAHDQVYGVWGGTTPEDRRRHRRRLRRRRAAAATTTPPARTRTVTV